MQSVVMGKKASQSLMRNLEQMVVEDKPKQFFIFKDGDTTYTFQKCSNTFGQYLELKVGGRRRSVIIPEVKEKRGWSLEVEVEVCLRKMLVGSQSICFWDCCG